MKWVIMFVSADEGRRPCPVVSSVVNDITQVGWIVIILTLLVVLTYLLACITLN
jgi:hypothetical protein